MVSHHLFDCKSIGSLCWGLHASHVICCQLCPVYSTEHAMSCSFVYLKCWFQSSKESNNNKSILKLNRQINTIPSITQHRPSHTWALSLLQATVGTMYIRWSAITRLSPFHNPSLKLWPALDTNTQHGPMNKSLIPFLTKSACFWSSEKGIISHIHYLYCCWENNSFCISSQKNTNKLKCTLL